METAKTVKDVSPHEFVKAYADHLKRSGKEMEATGAVWSKIVKSKPTKDRLVKIRRYEERIRKYGEIARKTLRLKIKSEIKRGQEITIRDIEGATKQRSIVVRILRLVKHTDKEGMTSFDMICLDSQLELPHWTDIVKTGTFKELAPYDPNWYYIRTASIARKIYLRGGIGVGAFQRIYGGRKRNGSRPPHFCKSSGGVARHILQQLQAINIVDFDTNGGRKITSSGRRDLDQVAGRIGVVTP